VASAEEILTIETADVTVTSAANAAFVTRPAPINPVHQPLVKIDNDPPGWLLVCVTLDPSRDGLPEGEVHGDLGVEDLRHRAVLLGCAGQLLELVPLNPGHLRAQGQRRLGNLEPLALLLQ
jgi:hypothetical protein